MSEPKSPQDLVDDLVQLLTVQRNSDDNFTGSPQKGGVGRVFGGQVIAQALMAAQQCVPEDKQAHSLHAYFLRGGKEGPPIDYTIARDFDGHSFANRRVVASQTEEDGQSRPILNMTASFQKAEEGLEHADYAMPDVAPPEELKSDMEMRREMIAKQPRMPEAARKMMLRPRPIEMRTIDRLHWMNSEKKEPRAHSWFKAAATLPDDPAIHRAVIAYASDYTLLGTSALPHGLSWMRGELNGASLDHSIWFHRPARADEWLLYATDSPWSGSGRGFNRGRLFNRDGELVASVAQEGMIRTRRAQSES
ncbi:acyl-CoA thioesterase [Pontixanthobacter aquaemixtae]|uniref:Acyl-CoA thioesterase 2 n=1 Tax=Pontixanthobacter aquaemixtae TaxID=1958940 RepID=A0A844ZRH4_9SPHN|nr:acyl-CoA thioesterase II [Pontixanthobacter aquaemixtae]MXO89690.1 acyl-CoA thioesterase II [Pontixanthobacter aquaemixtae]